MLLAVASTAFAGEHYVEIWNPPEARLGQPVAKCKPKSGKTALTTHGMTKAMPRRVADPLAKPATTRRTVGNGPTKTLAPRSVDIPRITTPEGNVLRVNNGGTPVQVVR
jgi:hypothetical protein